jgi:hypothetical protein
MFKTFMAMTFFALVLLPLGILMVPTWSFYLSLFRYAFWRV